MKHFTLLLYDVTTLYFETHKPDDDLQARGFPKMTNQNNHKLLGLLVTKQGFPLIHDVFKDNTFEGYTKLAVVKKFQEQYDTVKPIIIADAAMLSQANRTMLENEGYQYIVGARLSNTKISFLQNIFDKLPKQDDATIRIAYPQRKRAHFANPNPPELKQIFDSLSLDIENTPLNLKVRKKQKKSEFALMLFALLFRNEILSGSTRGDGEWSFFARSLRARKNPLPAGPRVHRSCSYR